MKVYVICRQDEAPEAAFATEASAIAYAEREGLYHEARYDHGGYPDIFEMDVQGAEQRERNTG